MGLSHTKYDPLMAEAVAAGLTAKPKTLPSWLFYDETGDELFRQIMRIPEYYPTRCEFDILQQHKSDLLRYFKGRRGTPFRLIELGAGDGLKTEILLRYFVEQGASFTYVPVDISMHVLNELAERLSTALPGLQIEPMNKTYDEAFALLRDSDVRKAILFMGANIGNFSVPEASQFLKKLVLPLSGDDLVLIGFDLKKDPRVIHEAYDDPRGLTASFNLNILTRMNRELGANFNREYFTHFPYYDPATGTTKSFLVSTREHDVHISALGRSFYFGLWESIQTEVSQKYDVAMIEKLMALSGLAVLEIFYDPQKYFCDVLATPR